MDDQHKAYFGRTRTREADHTLIVQPYSPHLFRQGELPGPNILMDVLRKTISTDKAKAAWKAFEKAKDKKASVSTGRKWIEIMQLPCRDCSDAENQTTWKPLSAFTMHSWKEADLWKHVVAKGQDLQCLRCTNKQFLARNPFKKQEDKDAYIRQNPHIPCQKCTKRNFYTRFDDQMVQKWLDPENNEEIVCQRCVRGHCHEK